MAALAALFVWTTGHTLPSVVASHFGASGSANSFMPRGGYLALMLALVVVVPLAIGAAGQRIGSLPDGLLNLPNKAHWLAPERREASLHALTSWMTYFSAGLTVLLCCVHWLVVQANASQPPRIDAGMLLAMIGLFLAGTAGGVVALYRRFGRPG